MGYSKIDMVVPDIEKPYANYNNPQVKAANINTLKNIKSKYGSSISKWGQAFGIPDGVIIAFIATESGGNQYVTSFASSDIKGLMQIAPAPIYDTVTKWKSEVSEPIPTEFTKSIRAKIPELLKSGVKYDNTLKTKIVKLTGGDADFNIMMGTAHLRWLLERFSTILGGGQLNKAMVAYNAGAYTKALRTSGGGADITPVDSAVLAANKQVPSESRNYLLKMFGIDGFLSLIYKSKAI
jgi:soluble lytic murein transglycosylase-like protein